MEWRTEMNLVKLPTRFYVDHMERDLDTPVAVKESARHVWVSLDDPALPELLSDAEHYAAPGMFEREYFGLVSSARATVKAIKAARSAA
jgi:phenylpropionate dioxygenase-like ring-hydroxylating dioxygenase large terminal subunit